MTFIGLPPAQKAADARLAPLPFCEHSKCYCRDVANVIGKFCRMTGGNEGPAGL